MLWGRWVLTFPFNSNGLSSTYGVRNRHSNPGPAAPPAAAPSLPVLSPRRFTVRRSPSSPRGGSQPHSGAQGYSPGPPIAVQVDDHGVSVGKCLLVPALVLTQRLGPSAAWHRVPGGGQKGLAWGGFTQFSQEAGVAMRPCPPRMPGLPRSPDADRDARLGGEVQADGIVQQQLRPPKVRKEGECH